MKSFKFKFEVVERHRKQKEDEALSMLALAQEKLKEEINKRNSLISSMNSSLQRREELGDFPLSKGHFQLEDEFISGQKIRIKNADLEIERAKNRVGKVFSYFLKCRKDKKIIERLRENELDKHKKEVKKSEQKIQDDLYVMRSGAQKKVIGGGLS